MASRSLVNYVKAQLQAGYSPEMLTDYLLRYNYPLSQINEALREASKLKPAREGLPKLKIALIAASLLSLFLISGFIFFIFRAEKVPAEIFDVKLSLPSGTIETGSPLRFAYEISSFAEKGIQASVLIEVSGSNQAVILSRKEQPIIKKSVKVEKTLDLVGAEPGTYSLKITVESQSSKKQAEKAFIIAKTESQVEFIEKKECPRTCNDANECTRDYCSEETNYQCRHDVIDPCCGDGICSAGENYESCLSDCEPPESIAEEDIFKGKSIFERIETIEGISKRDYGSAMKYCDTIEVLSYRHKCYTRVAVGSGNLEGCEKIDDDNNKNDCYFEYSTEKLDAGICGKIIKESRRDQCYMEFVTKGDYTVCESIANKYLKQSCHSLQQLRSFDPSKINFTISMEDIQAVSAEEENQPEIKIIAIDAVPQS